VNRYELYRPLTERTLENYQVQYLARRYDFGKESLIAHLLIKEINARMDKAEAAVGIWRVHPFELYLQKGRQETALPLFRPEYLQPLLAGKDFSRARDKVFQSCWQCYRKVFPHACKKDLVKVIDPWLTVRRKGPSRYIDQLYEGEYRPGEENSSQWTAFIERIQPQTPTQRLEPPDVSAPETLLKKLTELVRIETGLGPRVARQLVEDVITLRNICCPRGTALKPGEMPLLVTHVSARLSEDLATRFRKLAPVIITVITPEEMKAVPETVPKYIEALKKRLVRVCFEAYRQNGLLTLMELQWIFQLSSHRISELLRSVQKEHDLIVPTPGTVLDAGRSMTHKKVIVGLHLKGQAVMDIAKRTHHSPRAVDNYIGTFEAVLILHLFGLPPPLMARILKRGISLIQEYIKLIDEVYKDRLEIKKYLLQQGVKI